MKTSLSFYNNTITESRICSFNKEKKKVQTSCHRFSDEEMQKINMGS